MIKYKDFQPSSFDGRSNFVAHTDLSKYEDYYVAPCKQNRDSGLLEESNFEVQLEEFNKVGKANEDFEVHRFGHWACGWYEIILIKPDTKVFKTAEEIENSLSDYPVLSDNHYSDKENNAVLEYWENMSLKERIHYCNKANCSIFSARHDEIPEQVYDILRDCIH